MRPTPPTERTTSPRVATAVGRAALPCPAPCSGKSASAVPAAAASTATAARTRLVLSCARSMRGTLGASDEPGMTARHLAFIFTEENPAYAGADRGRRSADGRPPAPWSRDRGPLGRRSGYRRGRTVDGAVARLRRHRARRDAARDQRL